MVEQTIKNVPSGVRSGWSRTARQAIAVVLVLTIGVGVTFWFARRGRPVLGGVDAQEATRDQPHVTKVTTALPRQGGIERTSTQPGTVYAFESAELYAKVSGYLKSQSVDFGSRVKQDQILAEIDVPEVNKAEDQAEASYEQALAQLKQAEARVKTAQAFKLTADAGIATAKAELERCDKSREYRVKQHHRIQALVARNAVEAQLADEEEDRLGAAVADFHAAEASVTAAEAQVAEAQAKIEQSEADLNEAKANVNVAKADLEKAKVMVSYTRIISPYDGVVTFRGFHRGAFIRSASDGGTQPLLSVARTDKMRVVVQVPDLDVPLVDVGDPAIVRISNIPEGEFRGEVSRFAEKEDLGSRTMHTEIDLSNSDHRLREGMYGGVTIELEAPSHNLTIPASALFEPDDGGGVVYVVRDGKAHRTPVRIARDNGVQVEVLKGLKPDEPVVIRANGALADLTPVAAESTELSAMAPTQH